MPKDYLLKDEKFTEMFLEMQDWNHFEDVTINKEIRDEIKLILSISPLTGIFDLKKKFGHLTKKLESKSSMDDIATFIIKTLYSSNDFIVYKV